MKTTQPNSWWQGSWAMLILIGYFCTLALVCSPALHAIIHHDIGHEKHPCAVMTLLNQQLVFTTSASLLGEIKKIQIKNAIWERLVVFNSGFLISSILEHAPPRL